MIRIHCVIVLLIPKYKDFHRIVVSIVMERRLIMIKVLLWIVRYDVVVELCGYGMFRIGNHDCHGGDIIRVMG